LSKSLTLKEQIELGSLFQRSNKLTRNMRTNDAQELANAKYTRQAQAISKTHYGNIERHQQSLAKGGAMAAAIDAEHVAMLRELCELYCKTQLESFVAEEILPGESDFREMLSEMEGIIRRGSGGEFWTPRPATNELLSRLAQSVYIDLRNQVAQLALEPKLLRSAQSSYSVNVQGDVIGGVQVGTGNAQIIKADHDTES